MVQNRRKKERCVSFDFINSLQRKGKRKSFHIIHFKSVGPLLVIVIQRGIEIELWLCRVKNQREGRYNVFCNYSLTFIKVNSVFISNAVFPVGILLSANKKNTLQNKYYLHFMLEGYLLFHTDSEKFEIDVFFRVKYH